MSIDSNIKQKADDIRTKVYGSEVRESLASGLEAMSGDVVNNTERQDTVESQFQQVIENTTDKDVVSAPEIIAARDGKPNLRARLDDEHQEVTAQLAHDVWRKDIPIPSTAISDEFKQILTGNAPVSKTLAPFSVDNLKTTFFKRGNQLFNKAAAVSGKRIESTTGEFVDSPAFSALIIPITPGSTLHKNDDFHHYAYYDLEMNYIEGGQSGVVPQRVLQTPSNTWHIGLSTSTNSLHNYMVNYGSEPLPYAEYEEIFETKYIKKLEVEKIMGSFGKDQVDFVTTGKNLFDKTKVFLGHFISASSGNMNPNASYIATDFIEVEPNTEYTRSYSHQMAFYDEYKSFVSGVSSGSTFTSPENAKYMRLTLTPQTLDTFQVEKGNEQSAFESFKYVLDGIEASGNSGGGGSAEQDEVLVFLPNEICIAVGRTIELYNKQVVWAGNMDDFHIQWQSTIGKSFKRKWSFTAETANIGEYELRINVYDNNMNQVATKATTVKVVDDVIETPVNLLNIGDSLSNNKPWYGELRNLSNNMIDFVGTRWNGMGGNLEGQRNEGRSGANAGNYLSGDYTYTYETNGVGSENPFWNPNTSKFDFNYYKTNYNVDPNAVQIFLGTNAINIDPTENANNIKAIVDGIRASDTSIPIFVVNTLYRGDQDGIGNQASNDGYSSARGQWKLEEDRKVFNLMVRLNEILKGYSDLHFVPIALTHDSEYNFGTVETPVNPRNTFTQPQPTEATHPQTAGYLQFADIMFSTIATHMS